MNWRISPRVHHDGRKKGEIRYQNISQKFAASAAQHIMQKVANDRMRM